MRRKGYDREIARTLFVTGAGLAFVLVAGLVFRDPAWSRVRQYGSDDSDGGRSERSSASRTERAENVVDDDREVRFEQLKTIEEPEVSPDGKWIAFSANNNGHHDIFVSRLDGSEMRNLSRFDGVDQTPDWSPDGTEIVFTSQRSGCYKLYIVNVATGAIRRLSPSESPEDMKRGGARELVSRGEEIERHVGPRWSRRTGRILFINYVERIETRGGRYAENPNFRVIDPVSGRIENLTSYEGEDQVNSGRWSSDGRRVYFRRSGSAMEKRCEVLALADRSVRKAFEAERAVAEGVAPSPVSDDILYVAKDSSGRWEMRIRGRSGQRAIYVGEQPMMNPSWTPDGKAIVYEAPIGSDLYQRGIFLVNVKSGAPRLLVAPGRFQTGV